jgi:hypothetical protein
MEVQNLHQVLTNLVIKKCVHLEQILAKPKENKQQQMNAITLYKTIIGIRRRRRLSMYIREC